MFAILRNDRTQSFYPSVLGLLWRKKETEGENENAISRNAVECFMCRLSRPEAVWRLTISTRSVVAVCLSLDGVRFNNELLLNITMVQYGDCCVPKLWTEK